MTSDRGWSLRDPPARSDVMPAPPEHDTGPEARDTPRPLRARSVLAWGLAAAIVAGTTWVGTLAVAHTQFDKDVFSRAAGSPLETVAVWGAALGAAAGVLGGCVG